jgi:hypothetical protein
VTELRSLMAKKTDMGQRFGKACSNSEKKYARWKHRTRRAFQEGSIVDKVAAGGMPIEHAVQCSRQ